MTGAFLLRTENSWDSALFYDDLFSCIVNARFCNYFWVDIYCKNNTY